MPRLATASAIACTRGRETKKLSSNMYTYRSSIRSSSSATSSGDRIRYLPPVKSHMQQKVHRNGHPSLVRSTAMGPTPKTW